MIQFWLDYPLELLNIENFKIEDIKSERYTKILNVVALLTIVVGVTATVLKKNAFYFAIVVLILSLTILIHSTIPRVSNFTATNENIVGNGNSSNAYDTGVYLVEPVEYNASGLNNILSVNKALNFNKGDIIALSSNGKIMETNIVADIQYKIADNTPVIVLSNGIKNNYSKFNTKILKVSDTSPNIVPPPDGNVSIQNANSEFRSDPVSMSMDNYYFSDVTSPSDFNLELSSMGPNGMENSYTYQGPPYGNLRCRNSSLQNPMGTIGIPEYDNPPTMYGTCNVGENDPNGVLNDTAMTRNQEATVSQRVDDLLFHKGNAQAQFAPTAIDTIPNDQQAFAHFCYRNPTNLVNAKYASIFVNDPNKFKLVTRLARATGTENGGAGGGH
jgi:hypothetical protein